MAWLLNDPPPRYGEELAKCQRYALGLNSHKTSYSRFGEGQAYAANAASILIPLPVSMRARPTASMAGDVRLVDMETLSPSNEITKIEMDEISANFVVLRVVVDGGLTVGKVYVLQAYNDTDADLFLDCNL